MAKLAVPFEKLPKVCEDNTNELPPVEALLVGPTAVLMVENKFPIVDKVVALTVTEPVILRL